eukprot:CAMPEP_0194317754 /NCGR_PEP_ID=MMETSP0171-20130528/14492_1 /TAXON_ID=218684 /ORGANISM="Corethron pennatum, Strain L29A3" /LENGTH=120 /DNA_ID=CAMNT_0039074463 /DNA_START=52 /DNA_END=411 /DNA_ORIENTATION=-
MTINYGEIVQPRKYCILSVSFVFVITLSIAILDSMQAKGIIEHLSVSMGFTNTLDKTSKTPVELVTNDDLFRLNRLKLEDNTTCGVHKCFFPTKDEPDVAYMIEQEKDKGEVFKSWQNAW